MSVKIIYSNIQGFYPKEHVIKNYIESNNINLALFVETKSKAEKPINYRNWSNIQIIGTQITNYPRGGSMAMAHPSLKLGKQNQPKINNKLNECLHFTIDANLDDKVHIFLTYIHPHAKLEGNIFVKACLFKYSLIIGDFNINKCKNSQLNLFLNSSDFCKHATAPTFLMANNNDSTPDVVLYSKQLKPYIESVGLFPDFGSDHLSMFLSLSLFPSIIPSTTSLSLNLNVKKCNVKQVNNEVKNFIDNSEELNSNIIKNFNKLLEDSIVNNSPFRKQHNFYMHELPPFIISMLKRKRQMYREYIKTNNPEFKSAINKFSKDIKKLIFQYRCSKWLHTCNDINSYQGKFFWSKIKVLSKYKKSFSLPTLNYNNCEFATDIAKANLFADYYEEVYTFLEDPTFEQPHLVSVDRQINQFFRLPFLPDFPPITDDEYFEVLNSGKNTAPGRDFLSRALLRQLDVKVHKFIISIYNYCLQNCYFPEEWKIGRVVVFPKPKTDSSVPSNYRPITLLPTICKNLEKIIKCRIYAAISNSLPRLQFGFTPHRSTVHPLFLLTHNLQMAKKNGKFSCAVFMDIRKAFDTVWHQAILFKLQRLNCPQYLILIVKAFLENRKLEIKIGNAVSRLISTSQGVPQGSPLSPLLYIIFAYDMFHDEFNRNKYGLQFADDTALVIHGNNRYHALSEMQNFVKEVMPWFHKWRIKINSSKTIFMMFYSRHGSTIPSINVDNCLIEPSKTAKYLGVHLDSKLNFLFHAKTIKQEVCRRAKYFRALSSSNEGLSPLNRTRVYKAICRPILEYSTPIFLSCKHNFWRIINIAERSALRSITRLRHPNNILHNPPNPFLYNECNIVPIKTRHIMLSERFYNNIINDNFLQLLDNSLDAYNPLLSNPLLLEMRASFDS